MDPRDAPGVSSTEPGFVRVLPEGVRVEVRDYGYGLPVLVEASDERVGAGMGLTIVDRLADSWEVDQFLPGKFVWFQFDGPVPVALTARE